jgi:tripartite-type tricarboxylate transporter receptor subunit TctC
MFKTAASLDILHIPYKGAGPAVVDVVGGQVPMMFALPGTARPHIESGKMRPLAITGARRFKGLPNVPTFTELGMQGMDATLIVGFIVPAKTPAAIVKTLHDTLASVLSSAEVIDRLGTLALDVIATDPERSTMLLRNETELWSKVVKSSGAKAE